MTHSGTAAAELVAGGWLMPPRIPEAAPPPPREVAPVVPVARQREAPPRPRVASPAPANRAPPPRDGKVRF